MHRTEITKRIEIDIAGRRYMASIKGDAVAQLHRVFPRAVLLDGRYITVWDDFRSISKNAKGRDELDAAILAHRSLSAVDV